MLVNHKFFNIQEVCGVKKVFLPNINFKRCLVGTLAKHGTFLLSSVYNDKSTPEDISFANNFSIELNTLATNLINYMYGNVFNSKIKTPDLFDKTINVNAYNLYLRHFTNNKELQEAQAQLQKITEDSNYDEDNQSDKEKELRLLISGLIDEQEEYNEGFKFLFKSVFIYYKEFIDSLVDDFKQDKPIAFNDIKLIIETLNEKINVDIDSKNFILTEIDDCNYKETMMGTFFKYSYYIYHWNGDSLVRLKDSNHIRSYNKPVRLSTLGLYYSNPKINDAIMRRAEAYIKYNSKPTYAYHTGQISISNGWFTTSYQATGRCMVDVKSLSELNPNFSDYAPYTADPQYNEDEDSSEDCLLNVSDEIKLQITPYIYIFSFVCKKWARTLITNISDISFRKDAFDKLIINPDDKDLMYSLVDVPKEISVGKDIIDGKGGGTIFLLAGPPGVGKSLSAETMAETLQRPLYMVGVGELGTDAAELESNLSKILQTASVWNAILLLDECDIFMEKRKDMDIHRNAMVGVFLRLLEYYPGILFLTTNRANNIDEAFYSRISLALQYENLTFDKKRLIWKNILSLYNINYESIDIDVLANKNINGRQIKNAVKLVNTYCAYKKIVPATENFIQVIERMESFTKD